MKRTDFLFMFPVLVLLLGLHQVKVVYDMQQTWERGTPVLADVVDAELKNMASQSHGRLHLRTMLPDGEWIEQKMSLPVVLIAQLTSGSQVPVRVLSGSGQLIIIEHIVRSQQRVASINAAVALLGTIMLTLTLLYGRRHFR